MQLAKIERSKLVLLPEALESVKRFPANTKWVVVFGLLRAGKSTLCNLIRGKKIFESSNFTDPCTDGIWISDPVQINNTGDYIVVVDTEGTDAGNIHQSQILALACLLACNGGVLVHNELHYAKTALNELSSIANAMACLRGLDDKQIPHLCFIVRDFEHRVTVNGHDATPDEFFESILEDCGDQYSHATEVIKEFFPRRKMFTIAPPGKIRPHFDKSPPNQLFSAPESKFKADFGAFMDWLMGTMKVKEIGGVACEGELLGPMLEKSVGAINGEGFVSMPNLIEKTMDPICAQRADTAIAVYNDRMARLNLQLLDNLSLQVKHQESLLLAIRNYEDNTLGYYALSAEKFLNSVTDAIRIEFQVTQHTLSELKEHPAEKPVAQMAQEVPSQIPNNTNTKDPKDEFKGLVHNALGLMYNQYSSQSTEDSEDPPTSVTGNSSPPDYKNKFANIATNLIGYWMDRAAIDSDDD